MPPRLVLASSSIYRARLLGRLGLDFVVDAAGIDESPLPRETAAALVTRLSSHKADAVAARHPASIVIASDQVGVLGEQLLNKPGTLAAARAQLRAASGNTVEFLTGLCVLDTSSGRRLTGVVSSEVHFRRLSDQEITDYVDRERPLDCAGSFKVEGLGIALFRELRLDDPTALEGLPLIRLCEYLSALGAPVLGHS